MRALLSFQCYRRGKNEGFWNSTNLEFNSMPGYGQIKHMIDKLGPSIYFSLQQKHGHGLQFLGNSNENLKHMKQSVEMELADELTSQLELICRDRCLVRRNMT